VTGAIVFSRIVWHRVVAAAELAVLVPALLMLSSAPARASVLEEKKMGRTFALQAAGQMPTITDPAVVDFVRGIGNRLVAGLGPQPFDYQFTVVAHPALNAFAVPGGHIYVFSGLIARASTVGELASVMGHEVAHVDAHHIVRQQQKTQLWNYASILGMLLSAVQPVLGAGAMAAAQSASLKFSREFEEEADFLGLRFMDAGGYDPAAMPAFFEKIVAEQRLNPSGVPPYLLTHPVTQDRIAKAHGALGNLKRADVPPAPQTQRDLEEAQTVIVAATSSPDLVVAEYEERVEKNPTDGFVVYQMGIVYAATGRFDAARSAFETARTLDGARERLPVRLGAVYFRLGEGALAKKELEAYLATHPQDAAAHQVLGRTLLDLHEDPAGIDHLERSVTLDPTLAESHRLLGQAYGRGDRQGDGFYHLAKAYELSGKIPAAHSHYVRAADTLDATDPRQGAILESIEELAELMPTQRGSR
jgi:predicted Zn-dependent protease